MARRFSSPPTDAEFFRARVFDEPLIPLPGPRVAAEDSALAKTILARARAGASEDVSAFEAFLTRYPGSRWKGALLLDMGIVYRRTGYITRALDGWEQAWGLLKGETDLRLRALADRAVGELAELSSRLGRYDRLERLFSEIEGRDVRGPASEKIVAAKEGFAVMQKEPERAFLCGPFGLDRILATTRSGYVRDQKIADAKSTRQGTSMRQMLELAESVGLKMQIARRDPGAPVIVPTLVHWRAGHFAALVQETEGRFLIQDPTFGDNLWIRQTALDDEASGYFLVPIGALPAGWRPVPATDGDSVWGKGIVGGTETQFQGSGQPSAPNSCPPPQRMANYHINLLLVNLRLFDSPVGYAPPIGPAVEFTVAYNQREVFQPQVPMYSNLGPKWTFDWFSYVEDDPANLSQNANVYLRGGGQETYAGFTPSNGTSGVHYRSRAVLVRTSAATYERRLADGSIELYGQPDGGSNYPRRVYLTQYADPQNNRLTYAYSYEPTSGGLRLTSATDAIGQVTTFAYDRPGEPLKITKVTDPFGRFAAFDYDASGRLSRMTDVIGITSDFTYGAADFLTTLTTPYGTTQFETGQNGTERWVETTDPLGARERVEYLNSTDQIASTEPVVPTGMSINNLYLHARNTFYWDKRAMGLFPAKDYTKARIYHWLHSGANQNLAAGILESEKMPLERRVWYNYPGQWATNTEGTAATPTVVGRVLDDGTTQLYKYEYNSKGKKIKETDPLGRETVYVYGTGSTPDTDQANGTGIDLLQVKQKNGAGYDVVASYIYNSQHERLTETDAAGQATSFSYTVNGDIETVVTPPRAGLTLAERTTTYEYYPSSDPVAPNQLKKITQPNSAAGSATSTFTYDGYGRLRTATDADGFTRTYDYDALDRLTRTTYPDGTYEETVYSRLDPEKHRDRLGRWTHNFHDALRRIVATRDAAGRTTTQQWCPCGSLDKVIDATNSATTWERDLQGRIVREVRADGAAWEYTYETTTSRLKQRKDPKNQIKGYEYFLDDTLKQVTYTDSQLATANLSFTYDPAYSRIGSMTDGTGTTSYSYHPAGVLGAGRLKDTDGPLTNDTVSYGHDELGRVGTQTINGVSLTLTYDSLGRITSDTNALGNFTYGFDGVTRRLASMSYPNGQVSTYTYFDNLKDRRLKTIHHQVAAGGATLSKNDYDYDASGAITAWKQQAGGAAPQQYDLGYDPAYQLTVATLKTTDPTPAVLKRYAYAYDGAGNRTAEQIDDSVLSGTHNSRNQLVSRQPGGALLFRGTVSESATVTVQGQPARVTADNRFEGAAPTTGGTNTVSVAATDPSGNVRTNTYQVNLLGATTTYSYDANGNLMGDGARTFEWDAENRLVALNQGTLRSEFTYDGKGRRIRIIEKSGGSVTSDRRFLWCDDTICEERDGGGSAVTKRFFGQGVQHGSTNYFYTTDHLGSIRELTDAAAVVRARYEYDPYGRRTRIVGDSEADFGFTGHYVHALSGLHLAWFRAYDTSQGRWVSEDPIGFEDGMNVYAYVHGNPVNAVDPEGLRVLICVAYPLQPKPTLPKSNSLYGYCLFQPVCFGCPPDPGDPILMGWIKVWVPSYAKCPTKCGYITNSGKPKLQIRGRGLSLCSFPID
jgi:RHS repeat-associated protein